MSRNNIKNNLFPFCQLTVQELPQNMFAMHAGKSLYTSHAWKHSSCFPKVAASNVWQMGHKPWEGFFHVQELLLDFAAWIDFIQLHLKFQNTFQFFKTCWWPAALSRLHDASQLPGSHTRYLKTMLKILVDRVLMHHIILFSVRWYFLWHSIDSHVSCHNNRPKQSVPRFPLYICYFPLT